MALDDDLPGSSPGRRSRAVGRRHPCPAGRRWSLRRPPSGGMTPAAAKSPNGVVVGRYQGTVMVTVHGELDLPMVSHLRLLLTDLIDDQGNVSVVVDLQDATASADDPGALGRFAEATKHAHGGHAVIVVDEPSARTLASRAPG